MREEDKALISRVGGRMGDENMMQDYVDIVRQLRDLIRERERNRLLTDPSHRKQREERRLKVEQLNAKSLSGYKKSISTVHVCGALRATLPGFKYAKRLVQRA